MRLKSFVFLFALLSFSQHFYGQAGYPYDSAWKKIDFLIQKKSLPKSALTEVNKVYAAAKKEQREDQWIRAAVYRIQLTENGQDEPGFRLNAWDSAIAGAPARVKAVLLSAEAFFAQSYSRRNRYRQPNQTNMTGDSSTDISTWPAGKLDSLVGKLYLRSLEDRRLLQQTSLKGYETILLKGNSRKLRPTLYDLLLFRALDYFTDPGGYQSQENVSYSPETDADLFEPANQFRHIAFAAAGNAKRLTALQLYQDILAFHAPDADASAAVDADIDRIQFVKTFSVVPGKDRLYLEALKQVTAAFPELPAAAQAGYLQADWFVNQASLFDPLKDTSHRYDLIVAKAIAARYASSPDSSVGKANCLNLLQRLSLKTLETETEKVNLPGLPFRVLVSYKNAEKIYGRIISIDDATRHSLSGGYDNNERWQKLAHFPAEKKFVFSLPVTNDFQRHRVEIPIDALPVGQYALFTSSDSVFSTASALAVSFFFNSSIAYAWRNNEGVVADRGTGKPLAGVSVVTYRYSYDNKSGKERRVKEGQFLTDAGGHFTARFPKEDEYSERIFTFSLGADQLTASNEYVFAYHNQNDDDAAEDEDEYQQRWRRASLFTDRGIYRPGQQVFVKTLLMNRDMRSGTYKAANGLHSKLYLVDAQQQHIDSLAYTSNSFGSFSASFQLPGNVLTGSFGIEDSLTGTSVDFSVEEYKRPKFFVSIDTPTGPLHLNDSIRFEGMAKAYAGNQVDGARVSYRVVREARFPYSWFFRTVPSFQEQQLATGTTVSDAQGKFTINFKAFPDLSLAPSLKPVFRYRVSVDVIDGNGESQEASGTVSVGAQSFQIVSALPKESVFSADSLIHFPVTTNDLNDRFQPHELTVKLYALSMPDRLIRERYWNQPDQYLLDKQSYIHLFPNDEYADEINKSAWQTGELIASRRAETRADGTFPLLVSHPERLSGWYLAVFSGADVNGDSIIDKRWIALGIDKSKKPLYPEYSIHASETTRGEPGTSVPILAGSAADVFVFRARVSLADSVTTVSRFTLNNEISQVPVRITEADRGGFTIEDLFIKDNRIYTARHAVVVPWSNKALAVRFKTWKDKTLPGSKETWTLQIDGPGKDKSIAEILSAMYDASLDAFTPFSWQAPDIYPSLTSARNFWTGSGNFGIGETSHRSQEAVETIFYKQYDVLFDSYILNRFGRQVARPMMLRGMASADESLSEVAVAGYGVSRKKELTEAVLNFSPAKEKITDSASTRDRPAADPAVAIRKNFNETAFFFPDLKTDADGNLSFSFTMPEALTKWKWMVFAHTKDLAFGLGEKSVITQKELMLLPNMPRFLRQGDSLQVPVKISNLSGNDITGKVRLDWRDAADSSERNTAFGNKNPEQSFWVPAGQSRTYFFSTSVAKTQQQPVYYRLVATSNGTGQLSDGEEGILPVLSNRRLVTETLPVRLNKEASKTFDWEKLLRSDSSKALQQHSLTVEYTTRPAWYAVQSLPYLMEFPYECAEQTFDRYYANALGQQIVNRVPGMAGVLAAWKSGDSSALQSNLEKNEELKTVLLKETPWVAEAQSETAQKHNLAKLLDKERLTGEMKKALGKLEALQSDAGGFPWFAGGRPDRYITQYIVTGIGHLLKLNALPESDQAAYVAMVKKALVFLDAEIKRDYDNRPKKATNEGIGALQIQYLYMRSFFRDIDVPGASFFALNYYRLQSQKYWPDQNMYLRGMIALFLNRNGDKKTAQEILKSLRENAISNDKDGTYWKQSGLGYYWQESPVETQSLLIEAFAELGQDGETDNLKWWLLQQKQTTHWSSTRSTADACYALLMNGSDWLGSRQDLTVQLGNETITSATEKTEAGTGYFKKIIPAEKVVAAMGHITISTKPVSGKTVPSFGAIYWQYFEELGNITAANTSLAITKTLFVQKNTGRGVVGEALAPGAPLHVGDKLLLRFIIKTDRDLDYVQLKDQRAACFEPVQALSGYQWQGDLGYYQAPGDESTSFFFDYLPKGTHVVEYPVYVTTNGVFSGGISTLQTMYAPEFSGHTAGSRLHVTEK